MRPATTLLAFCALTLATLSGCKDPEPENFGTVKIELSPVAGSQGVFNNTTEVVVTLLYGDCLQDFYLVDHPEYQKDGVKGASLFEEWSDKLCDPDLEKVIDCEVTSIDQDLIENTNIYQLKVTYAVKDPSTLQLGYIHVGPFPTEDYAGETCDTRPTVELRANGVIGRDGNGTQIWGIKTLPGSSIAVANQGAPLRIDVGM
ncbi:hypothetical protein ACNOYE_00230 [Nannocystaceae bacterium ST9]